MAQTLKCLGLDFDLDDARMDFARFESAQTALGYDVVFVKVTGLLPRFRQGEIRLSERDTFNGVVVPGLEAARALSTALAKRRKDLDAYLKQGGTVVAVLGAPEDYMVEERIEKRTDEVTGDEKPVRVLKKVTTVEEALPIQFKVEAVKGRAMQLASGGPFAVFWEHWKTVFSHEAVITRHDGTTLLHVVGTTRPVAAAATHDDGLVLLLPDFGNFAYPTAEAPGEEAPDESENPAHRDFIDSLVQLRRELAGEVELPAWAEKELQLPGEAAARRKLSGALAKRDEWSTAAVARSDALRQIERRKALVTATGTALELLAEEAFLALGFDVEQGNLGRADRIVRLGENVAVVEIKGVKGSATERHAAQLTKWVASYHADHGVQPKGILVVNAFCQTPLSQRSKEPFPDQMRGFAVEQQQFCLLTARELLDLWLKADADPTRAPDLAASILGCVGVYGEA